LFGGLKAASRVNRCLDFILSQLGLRAPCAPVLHSHLDVVGSGLLRHPVCA